MFESYLLSRPWLVAAIWAVLYASDYYLTIWGAKLREAQDVWELEGSYEMTPEYQKDIDRKRLLSPRFIIWLTWGAVILLATGYMAGGRKEPYGFVVGFLLVPEVFILKRHLSNIAFFKEVLKADSGISGAFKTERAASYRHSAADLAAYAVILLLLFAVADSYVLLGGAFALGIHAYRDLEHSKRAKLKPTPVPQDAAD